jgi:hypothetical protein
VDSRQLQRSAELLLYAYGQIQGTLRRAVEGLTPDELTYRIGPEANTIAWLAWHLARVQDDHVAEVAGTAQVWTAGGWYDRFDLPFDPGEHGYGQSSDAVAAVRVPADLLVGYHDAVHDQSVAYVRTLSGADLDRVVDDG